MTACSPTPSWPTRSPRAEGRTPGRCAALALLLSVSAAAHELEDGGVPDLPGWRLGAAVALDAADADNPWPSQRRSGLLLTGERPRDRRGAVTLEQAMVDGAVRLNRWLGAQVSVGAHDRDDPRVETARLELQGTLAGQPLRLRAGRQSVALGSPVDNAGHFDRYAQVPLAKLAVLNEHWIDDGLQLDWQRPEVERGLRSLGLGLWRARAFPGGPQGPVAPSVRATAVWDHWAGHLLAAALQPESRGAAALGSGPVGHTHGVPDCSRSVLRLVCFDGDSQVLGTSLGWDSADGRWQASGAALWRRERGTLYTSSGSADYRGDTVGAWADLAWQWRPDWTLAARAERLTTRHGLTGPGASLVASAAGLSPAEPRHRLTLALGHQGLKPLSIWLEAGAEQMRGQATETHVLLRLLWQAPHQLEGGF